MKSGVSFVPWLDQILCENYVISIFCNTMI